MKINPRITKTLLSFCIVGLFFVSCNKGVVFTKYQTFNDSEWYAKNKVVFDVDISDDKNLHDISVMVRHADAYPYSNLFLFLTTNYPDGKTTLDTLELILANGKGEWMGDGAGDIFDISIPLKKSVKFPLLGKYTFTFEQAMRTDPLPLVMDFGMEIKKSKGN